MAKKATIEDFKSWIGNIGKFSRSPKNIEIVDDEGEGDGKGNWEQRFRVRIYTNTKRYGIIAVERSKDKGYLGCTASSRMPRAGETWTRGNDLADGPLTKKTWHAILGDIVSYEMVDLNMSKPKLIGEPDLPTTGYNEDGDCSQPSLGVDGLPEGDVPADDEPTGTVSSLDLPG